MRFLDLLTTGAIKVKVHGVEVTLPHPVNFALHKLIISLRRPNLDKAEKDRRAAVETLKCLIAKGQMDAILDVLDAMPAKWRKKVFEALNEGGEEGLLVRVPPRG